MIIVAHPKDTVMSEFIDALFDPNIAFLRNALFAGLLASLSFGIIGSYVVVKRISYIAGAISHCVLGGIGAALYIQGHYGITWFTPTVGAITSALAAALIIGLVSLKSKEREDSVIGALWVLGMAVGILLISKTPGYIDPMSYLFGNILLITTDDLWTIALLDGFIVTAGILLYNKLLSTCFDEEFARLRGINTSFYYLLLLCLTALTIVLMVRIVGIVMVVALLTLPAAIASKFAKRLWQMMVASIIISMLCITGGLAISYGPNLPSGATIVALAGSIYLLMIVFSNLRKYIFSNKPS